MAIFTFSIAATSGDASEWYCIDQSTVRHEEIVTSIHVKPFLLIILINLICLKALKVTLV